MRRDRRVAPSPAHRDSIRHWVSGTCGRNLETRLKRAPGRDKPVPYDSVFPARSRPGTGSLPHGAGSDPGARVPCGPVEPVVGRRVVVGAQQRLDPRQRAVGVGGEFLHQLACGRYDVVIGNGLVGDAQGGEFGTRKPASGQRQLRGDVLAVPQAKPGHVVRSRHALLDLADLQERGLAGDEQVRGQCECRAAVDGVALQGGDDGLAAIEDGLVGATPDGAEARHPVRRRVGVESLEIEAGAECAVGAAQQYRLDLGPGVGPPDRRGESLAQGTVDRVPALGTVQHDLGPPPVIDELH